MSFASLIIEHLYIVEGLSLARSYTCYVCLPLVVFSLMGFVLKMRENNVCLPYSLGIKLRKMSTINYCSHASFAYVLAKYCSVNDAKLLFLMTLVLCIFISKSIFTMESKKGFYWLKYSH